MADTRITILGMTGSGKTCYLLGMYYKMCSGMRGYTIITDEDTDVDLKNRYAKICDQTLGQERFPAGTDNTSKYEFNLQYAYKTIMSFDWMDYPGITLAKKNQGNLEEYDEVKNSISKSSSLFICVDGSLLMGDSTEEKIERIKDNCSSFINPFFSEYMRANNTLPPTAIVITKYDLCKNDTDESELCEIIEEAFSPFFVEDKKNRRIVTIIPVSIGSNIKDDNYSGILKPLNIHLPIFMGIWFALSKRIQDHISEKNKKEKELSRSVDNLRCERVIEENKWWFFKNETEIENLTKIIQQKQNSGERYSQQMEDLLLVMEKYSNKLKEELKKISLVYIDGEKGSFSNII